MSKSLWDREALIYNTIEADFVYLTFDEFAKNHSRKNVHLTFHEFAKNDSKKVGSGGARLLTNWVWKPSYKKAVKRQITKVLEFFEAVIEDDPYGGYTQGAEIEEKDLINDTSCHLYYTDHDYIILKYTSLWNAFDRVYKVYVTDADEDKVRKFLQAERKIADDHLSV